MSGGYLIYHPRREVRSFGERTVHFDTPAGNQDPYIWNRKFLHTFCHMAQMSPVVGDTCFWVGGDTWPNFQSLYCDLVFVVESKCYWKQANSPPAIHDTLVDSDEAWNDHYRWSGQHPYRRRRRFTLKADPHKSYQPQGTNGSLIDLVPFLQTRGCPLSFLRAKIVASPRSSRPMRIDVLAPALYQWLDTRALVKVFGEELQKLRAENSNLASPPISQGCC